MSDHIHKYRRVRLGKTKDYVVYKCALPDCPHYIDAKLVLGRSSICWKCGDRFIMSVKSMKLKPTCPKCQGQKIEITQEVDNLLERLGIE